MTIGRINQIACGRFYKIEKRILVLEIHPAPGMRTAFLFSFPETVARLFIRVPRLKVAVLIASLEAAITFQP